MLKVVVVEDEELVRKGIVLTVDWAGAGCAVVGEAANGEEGLEVIRRYRPDLIVTDIRMPKLDGIEMLRRLREEGNRAHVVFLTAYSDFSYAQSALKLGAADYLLKPFHDGELEETATGRLGGLEIKTTEILSSTGWTHWKGRIPTEYYAQVCQQMLAAGWQFVELLAQIKYTTAEGEDRKETRHYKIERADAEDDIAIIRREAVPFWRCVEQRQKPNLKLPPI